MSTWQVLQRGHGSKLKLDTDMQTYFKRGETDFLLIAVKFNDAYIYTSFWKLYSDCSMLYTVQGKEMPFEMQI